MTETLEPPPAGQLVTSAVWSVLRIDTGKELLAGRHLAARGISAYIPTYTQVRRWRDHAAETIIRALFPGYAFAQLEDPHARTLAVSSPHVFDLLTIGPRQPATLDQLEMDRIKSLGDHHPEPWQALEPGQRVRILEGPFTGVEGLLLKRKSAWRFVITVAMLGRSASIEIDGWELERVQ